MINFPITIFCGVISGTVVTFHHNFGDNESLVLIKPVFVLLPPPTWETCIWKPSKLLTIFRRLNDLTNFWHKNLVILTDISQPPGYRHVSHDDAPLWGRLLPTGPTHERAKNVPRTGELENWLNQIWGQPQSEPNLVQPKPIFYSKFGFWFSGSLYPETPLLLTLLLSILDPFLFVFFL